MDEYEKERRKQIEEAVVETYKQEEEMMILVFAQWCANHGLDPEEMYRQAYPDQQSMNGCSKCCSWSCRRKKPERFRMIRYWVCCPCLATKTWPWWYRRQSPRANKQNVRIIPYICSR